MLLAALLLQLAFGAGIERTEGELPGWAHPAPPEGLAALLRTGRGDEGPATPACFAEFCQPRVVIPGKEVPLDTRGKRSEMAIMAIERLGIGPVSAVARVAGTAGLRLDYRPKLLDRMNPGNVNGGIASVRGGATTVGLGFRWRLDAWHGPTWLTGP